MPHSPPKNDGEISLYWSDHTWTLVYFQEAKTNNCCGKIKSLGWSMLFHLWKEWITGNGWDRVDNSSLWAKLEGLPIPRCTTILIIMPKWFIYVLIFYYFSLCTHQSSKIIKTFILYFSFLLLAFCICTFIFFLII